MESVHNQVQQTGINPYTKSESTKFRLFDSLQRGAKHSNLSEKAWKLCYAKLVETSKIKQEHKSLFVDIIVSVLVLAKWPLQEVAKKHGTGKNVAFQMQGELSAVMNSGCFKESDLRFVARLLSDDDESKSKLSTDSANVPVEFQRSTVNLGVVHIPSESDDSSTVSSLSETTLEHGA